MNISQYDQTPIVESDNDILKFNTKQNALYVGDVQDRAIRKLKSAGIESHRLEADLIVAHVTGVDRVTLFAHPEIPITMEAAEKIEYMLHRRIAGYPLAYLLGQWEFYGLQIEVREGVLIPRNDTETLIEASVSILDNKTCLATDLGCGSGCISLALASVLPNTKIIACDTSDIAVDVTASNVQKQGLVDRIQVKKQDMNSFLLSHRDTFDAVLSNPPYIESNVIAGLQPEVSLYEPKEALDGGPDGLKYYPAIFEGAFIALRAGGFVAVEVGAGQAPSVSTIASEAGFSNVRSYVDLAGIERVVVGYK